MRKEGRTKTPLCYKEAAKQNLNSFYIIGTFCVFVCIVKNLAKNRLIFTGMEVEVFFCGRTTIGQGGGKTLVVRPLKKHFCVCLLLIDSLIVLQCLCPICIGCDVCTEIMYSMNNSLFWRLQKENAFMQLEQWAPLTNNIVFIN